MIPRQSRKFSSAVGTQQSQHNLTRIQRSISPLLGKRWLPFVLQALVFIFLGVLSDRIVIWMQTGDAKDAPFLSAPSPVRESPRNVLVPLTSTPKSSAPANLTTTPTSGTIRYLIQPGDTLITIAARYRVSVQSIRDANSLSGDMIVAGEYLVIPQSNASSP